MAFLGKFVLFLAILHCTMYESTQANLMKLKGNYPIIKNEVTLSGLSAGGSFAQILHLSHSSCFTGIGIFASFFYRCGNYSHSLEGHYAKCGKPGGFPTTFPPNPALADPALAVQTAKDYAAAGLIDPLENLKKQRLHYWQGTIDEFILPKIGLAVINIYEPQMANPRQIRTKIQYSHHHFPTVPTGAPCAQQSNNKDAYIGSCDYDGAHDMLQFILSTKYLLGISNNFERAQVGRYEKNQLQLFNQREFFEGVGSIIGMDEVGFIYVPKKCESAMATTKCLLHFYFHGGQVGSRHIEGTGLLEVAEKNNIIIVFPMAKVESYNSGGCFDFFGYTGPDYGNKNGIQVRIVKRIMDRLLNS